MLVTSIVDTNSLRLHWLTVPRIHQTMTL